MSRTLHDSLEITLTCIHIDIWVDEGMEDRLCSGKDLYDIAISHVIVTRLLAILLLKQDSRNGLPFAEESRLGLIWTISSNKS